MNVAVKAVKPMKGVEDLNLSHGGGLEVYQSRRVEMNMLVVLAKGDSGHACLCMV